MTIDAGFILADITEGERTPPMPGGGGTGGWRE
jgi:hypothetical protein